MSPSARLVLTLDVREPVRGVEPGERIAKAGPGLLVELRPIALPGRRGFFGHARNPSTAFSAAKFGSAMAPRISATASSIVIPRRSVPSRSRRLTSDRVDVVVTRQQHERDLLALRPGDLLLHPLVGVVDLDARTRSVGAARRCHRR